MLLFMDGMAHYDSSRIALKLLDGRREQRDVCRHR